jgi:hypothetical protein
MFAKASASAFSKSEARKSAGRVIEAYPRILFIRAAKVGEDFTQGAHANAIATR